MKRNTIVILGIVLLVIVLLCAAAAVALLITSGDGSSDWQPRWDRDRTQWDSHMWAPADGSHAGLFVLGLLGLVSCLLLVAGLVLGGIWLASSKNPRATPPGQPAELQDLRGRYARGEISREEYLAQRGELGH